MTKIRTVTNKNGLTYSNITGLQFKNDSDVNQIFYKLTKLTRKICNSKISHGVKLGWVEYSYL